MKPALGVAILLMAGSYPAMAGVIEVTAESPDQESHMFWTMAVQQAPLLPFDEVMLPAPPPALALTPELCARFAQSVHFELLAAEDFPGTRNFHQVPAPGSLALFGTGLLGLAFARHRRSL